MALRLLLVGLVACLGFEIPTLGEVASWRESSYAWLAARGDEVGSLRVATLRWLEAQAGPGPTVPATAPDAPTASGSPSNLAIMRPTDDGFEAITAAMARDFSRDGSNWAVADDPPVAEVDEIAADPLGAANGSNRLVLLRSQSIAPEVAPEATAHRLSSAVRLTHEACRAWASLIVADGLGESVQR